MWGREKAREYLRAAGMDDVTIHRLDHDLQNDYYVSRKAESAGGTEARTTA